MVELRRKLYRRGSSFETTIPMPMLFGLDLAKRHNVIFSYDRLANRWFVNFEAMLLAGKKRCKKEAQASA